MKDSDWEFLYELYKNPNMSKVASLLYVTQPSLTKRLQYMESEFQVAIVNRTPKGLEFTPEGEYLAERAKLYLDFMKETKEGLDLYKVNTEYIITIGTSYTYSKFKLPDVLVKCSKEHPDIKFQVINDQSNNLFRKLLEDTIDVAFISGDYDGSVNRVLIGSSDAYLVTKEPVELKDLLKMQRIEYSTNDRTKELLRGWWERQFNKEEPAGMAAGFIDVAWQLISKGLGYTCCFLPEDFENEYNLCLTPLLNADGTKIKRNTWFIYSKNKRLSKGLVEFIGFIEKELSLPKDNV
jgi:DNA-binding transcriptional LysR family regulator